MYKSFIFNTYQSLSGSWTLFFLSTESTVLIRSAKAYSFVAVEVR